MIELHFISFKQKTRLIMIPSDSYSFDWFHSFQKHSRNQYCCFRKLSSNLLVQLFSFLFFNSFFLLDCFMKCIHGDLTIEAINTYAYFGISLMMPKIIKTLKFITKRISDLSMQLIHTHADFSTMIRLQQHQVNQIHKLYLIILKLNHKYY